MGFNIRPKSEIDLAREEEILDQNNFRAGRMLDELEQNRSINRSAFIQDNMPEFLQNKQQPGNTNIQYSNSNFIPQEMPRTNAGNINGNAILDQMRKSRNVFAEKYPYGYGSATIYK